MKKLSIFITTILLVSVAFSMSCVASGSVSDGQRVTIPVPEL